MIVTICSWCSQNDDPKILSDATFGDYLVALTAGTISHGICQGCMEDLINDTLDKRKGKECAKEIQ